MKTHHFYNKYTFPKTYGNLSLKHRGILMFIFPKDILSSFTADYVYNPHYPKVKTQENQNNLKKDFDILLALKEVMLDNKLEGCLKDMRQR